MPEIIVTPDLYYHRWDKADGELWACLRAYLRAPIDSDHPIGDLADFHDWAREPHLSAGFTYSAPTEDLCGTRFDRRLRLVPIPLPTEVDIWVQIHGDGSQPAPWLRIARDVGCKTSPARLANGLEDLFTARERMAPDANQWAFARWFNETVKRKWQDGGTTEVRDQLASWLELRLESGKLISWICEDGISDLFRNEASPRKPPLPLFRADAIWQVGCASGTRLETNLYWLFGQMFPLGRKPAADQLNKITGVDIHLARSDVPIGATELPEAARLYTVPAPPPILGQPPARPYFESIADTYDARLVCGLFPSRKAASDPGETRALAYVSPVLSAFSQSRATKTRWRIGNDSAQQAVEGNINAVPGNLRAGGKRLDRLGALEIRSGTPLPAASRTVQARPAAIIAGMLRSYRRFPQIAAPGPALATVMQFEPDPDSRIVLAALRQALGQAGLAALYSSASIPGWALEVLPDDPLPWDGPEPVYRILARPTSSDTIPTGFRTLQPQSLTFVLVSRLPLPAEHLPLPSSAPQTAVLRWLWKPGAGVTQANLRDDLRRRLAQANESASWADMLINALVLDVDLPEARSTVDALFLDEYSFELADSRVRLERYLKVETRFPGGAPPAQCDASFTPLEDFEDDLVNFNTASIAKADGSALDLKVRFAQTPRAPGAAPDIRNLHRDQIIPLVIEWDRDLASAKPARADAPPPNPADFTWQQIRAFTSRMLLDDLPEEPFGIRLEHTYGTYLEARGQDGSKLAMQRSSHVGMAVDSPTAAEAYLRYSDAAPPDGQAATPDVRFLICSQPSADKVRLEFDTGALDPAELRRRFPAMDAQDCYLLAFAAWRSVAEIAAADQLDLRLDLIRFDLNQLADGTVEKARHLATAGAPAEWTGALHEITPIVVNIPKNGANGLQRWALALMDASLSRLPVGLRVDLNTGAFGTSAHIAQARLHIGRTAARKPPQSLRYLPVTAQAGLGPTDSNSLLGAWTDLGFRADPEGTDMMVDFDQIGGEPFRQARQEWVARLSTETDSITPASQTVATGTGDRTAVALISQLAGTDWFAPAGSPAGPELKVQPLLLPFGFAPCAPHPQLGRSSQEIIQRLLEALSDAADLAYLDWARSGIDYAALLRGLGAIARRSGSEWAGPLPDFLGTLVESLLQPQPADDSRTEPRIDQLARAFRRKVGQIQHVRESVRRQLLFDPATYSEAKALLLTRIDFADTGGSGRSPEPGTLARGRFSRRIRPARVASQEAPAELAAVVGIANLVGAGNVAGNSDAKQRFGFLEPLADTQYDNAFDVRRSDYSLESFEEVVDPRAPADPVEWHHLPPLVPAAAENAQTADERRQVRLASRAIVIPPELIWSGLPGDPGQAGTLRHRLDRAQAGQIWPADAINLPLRDQSGQPVRLRTIALRPLNERPDSFRADEDVVAFVYRIRGDEEARTDLDDAFSNDAFTARIERDEQDRADTAEVMTFEAIDPGLEKDLRGFLEHARGSAGMGELVRSRGLAPATYAALAGLAKAYTPTPPSGVILRPDIEAGNVHISGSDPARVRDVLMLRPADAQPGAGLDPVCYLVVTLILDTWTGWQLQMAQTRNMPIQDGDQVASTRQPANFAPEFWQSAPQSTAPDTRRISVAKRNPPGNWDRPRYFYSLPANIDSLSIFDLVDRLLLRPGMLIAGMDPANPGILSRDSGTQIYRNRLAVTIHQEQSEGVGRPPRSKRHAFPTVACLGEAEARRSMVSLPAHYRLLSADFHWFRPSGSLLFALERIFLLVP